MQPTNHCTAKLYRAMDQAETWVKANSKTLAFIALAIAAFGLGLIIGSAVMEHQNAMIAENNHSPMHLGVDRALEQSKMVATDLFTSGLCLLVFPAMAAVILGGIHQAESKKKLQAVPLNTAVNA